MMTTKSFTTNVTAPEDGMPIPKLRNLVRAVSELVGVSTLFFIFKASVNDSVYH
jgi:hypothetical protein